MYRAGRANRIAPETWAASFQRLKPRELFLTGGEPTLYKQLPEFIGLLPHDIELVMHSNFGRSFSVDRFLEHVAPDRFRELVLSLHPTQIEPAEYFAKLGRLHAAGYRGLMVEMVLYPQNLPVAGEAFERCRELGISLRFDPYVPAVHDPVGRDAALMAEMRGWVDKAAAHTKDLGAVRGWNFDRPQFWEVKGQPELAGRSPIFCPAGSQRVNVDELGDVYTCMSAIDRSKLFDRLALPHYAPTGNIFSKDFQFLDRPILCWESFRCSSCDFQSLDSAWTKSPCESSLPLPE